jgi:hypothetical protein
VTWTCISRTPEAELSQAYTDLGTEPPTAGFDHSQVVEFLRSRPGFFRIDSRTDVWGAWQPDLALLAGLEDVSGVDNPLVIADMARYLEGSGGRSTRLYDLLGVEYVLGSKTVTLDWNKFDLVFDGDPTVNVYRNATSLPRAFIVHRAVAAADHEDAWARLHEAGFDPAGTVVLEGGQALDVRPVMSDTVNVVRYQPDELEIDVEAGAEGYLVLSDPFYPGWRAELDGEPVALLRADYAFRAVAVPAGHHTVVMTFRPGTWNAGLIISALTALVMLGLGVWGLVRRARRRRPAAGSL